MIKPLKPRHERFAQGIAAGMLQIEAYVAAGYARNEGEASRLRKKPQVAARIAELCASSAQAVVQAIAAPVVEQQELMRDGIAVVRERHALIRQGYEKLREHLDGIEVNDAGDWKALADAVLALDKDQRVVDGGVSDRTESDAQITTRDEGREELQRMMDALARRTSAPDSSTKH
jgi:hypothetical protein